MASENIDKMKALDLAMRQIEKDFGKGSIMKLGEASSKMNIEVIPTGALSLDIALGVGGIPRGRVIEIYGPESSGKTTVALHMIAEAQKLGGYAAFIDAEHALDPEYARRLGVDVDNLLISQPDNGEQALEIADALVRSGYCDRGLCSGACSEGGDRRRYGRFPCGTAGAPDEPGTAQTDRFNCKIQMCNRIY